MVSETLKLWFFRDLNDEQRLKLFGLFGLPVDKIGKVQGRQQIALRHIVERIIKMTMKETIAALSSPVEPVSGWQPIETYMKADKFVRAQHIFVAHDQRKWVRMGRWYPEVGKWYYSGTNERSQWAQVEGDAPTHWQPLPAPPEASQ